MERTHRSNAGEAAGSKPRRNYPAFLGAHTRTKIVCTIGPASRQPAVLAELAQAGADVFRLNFSHGTHEQHLEVIQTIRQLSSELRRPLGILGDLSGPKIRVGEISGGRLELKPKDEVVFTGEDGADGSDGRFTITYRELHEAVRPGEEVLLDDGAMRLVVRRLRRFDVVCEVIEGGTLLPRKGVNLPHTTLTIPSLTDKDKEDLAFALENHLDAVALSFVRRPEDIVTARRAMERLQRSIPLIAKIEKAEAINELEGIIRASDGVMVARGDLGVELPLEKIPAIQKRVIQLANAYARPVITATQMLESMIRSPRPTRAEVTDVFNAVTDGTDAVMLSGETAAGAYPVQCVEYMGRIVTEAEQDGYSVNHTHFHDAPDPGDLPSNSDDAIARAAVQLSERLNLDAILVPTTSGSTVRRVSRYRPRCPILACCMAPEKMGFLNFSWGVEPRQVTKEFENNSLDTSDAVIAESLQVFRSARLLHPGMQVAVIAGVPAYRPGVTNLLRIVTID